MQMTSSRPYLLRALYQWIADNGLTPHLLVGAPVDAEDLQIPWDFVEGGKIVLNVSPTAVRGLVLGDQDVAFNARFRGQPMDVLIPIQRVLAIYARENGQGMLFGDGDTAAAEAEADTDTDTDQAAEQSEQQSKRSAAPHLRVVK